MDYLPEKTAKSVNIDTILNGENGNKYICKDYKGRHKWILHEEIDSGIYLELECSLFATDKYKKYINIKDIELKNKENDKIYKIIDDILKYICPDNLKKYIRYHEFKIDNYKLKIRFIINDLIHSDKIEEFISEDFDEEIMSQFFDTAADTYMEGDIAINKKYSLILDDFSLKYKNKLVKKYPSYFNNSE